MRPLLLSVTLLLSANVSAQKFELGLNGGMAFNDKTANLSSNVIINGYGQRIIHSEVICTKGFYTGKKWQAGISVEFRRASYRVYDQNYVGHFSPSTGVDERKIYVDMHRDRPYYPLMAFVNRKRSFNNIDVYGGVSLGCVFMSGLFRGISKISISDLFVDTETRQQHADWKLKRSPFGLAGGVQGGCTWYFSKQFGINAEVSANYVFLRQENFAFDDKYNAYTGMLSIPITLGVRHRL